MISKTENEPPRVGAMISCISNEEIERNLPRILVLFPKVQNDQGWHPQDSIDWEMML